MRATDTCLINIVAALFSAVLLNRFDAVCVDEHVPPSMNFLELC